MTDETEAAVRLVVSQALEERLIRIETQLESLNRSINMARGGLHVLIWLGGVATAVTAVVVAILTYLHIREP